MSHSESATTAPSQGAEPLDPPLDVAAAFDDLAAATARRLAAHDPRRVDVPASFAARCGDGRLATTRLRADAWSARRFDLRATTILGPTVAIFNAMAFPAEPERVPIFASELIVFGGVPRVAVVDLQPVWRDLPDRDAAAARTARLHAALAPLAAAFADLPPGGDLPAWCDDYFTPHAIWSRPADARCLPRLLAAHHAYLDAWCRACLDAPAPNDPPTGTERDAARAALARYKLHHRTSSPGLPYLGRVFGPEWTEEYLRTVMYA